MNFHYYFRDFRPSAMGFYPFGNLCKPKEKSTLKKVLFYILFIPSR